MTQLRCPIIALLLALSNCVHANGQVPKLPKIERFGIDGFRLMLQKNGLRASPSATGSAFGTPDKTIAILLGDLTTAARIRGQLHRFVNAGGSLLVASDVRNSKIPGGWIRATKSLVGEDKTEHGFRGYGDCPIVTNFNNHDTPLLFDGVEEIVTNRPGQLDCAGTVQPIAWLPSRFSRPFMAMYQKESGRMLLVADHSLFINEMLVHGDNARLVNNICSWLCENGKRTNLVLIHDGQVLPDWSFGDSPPAIPLGSLLRAVQRGGLENLPIGESVLPIVNESVADFQRQNGFNRTAHRFSNLVFGRLPIRILMIMTTVVLAAGFLGWLVSTRSRPRRWLSTQSFGWVGEVSTGRNKGLQ